jgi:hypothetical protein
MSGGNDAGADLSSCIYLAGIERLLTMTIPQDTE